MTKSKNILLIDFLRAFIKSNMVINSFRAEETDFTRERKLPFWTTTLLILTSWKKSIHNRLNLFFTHLDLVAGMPEASAFCQARKKIKPELFITLRNETVKFFYDLYEKEGLVKRWKGRILCAIDGSIFNIPDTKETTLFQNPVILTSITYAFFMDLHRCYFKFVQINVNRCLKITGKWNCAKRNKEKI